jgi:hypothetical protein
MPDPPFPSAEFGENTRRVLAQAGTVRLPSPPPATGELYLGINPNSHEELRSGTPRFYLRSVQKVGRAKVVKRIVALDELRAVSLPPGRDKGEKAPREFRVVNDIAKTIAEAKERLIAAERDKPGVYEVCLFPDAVIYVRESAPVYVRIESEFALSAAEAAEHIEHHIGTGGCCMPVGDPVLEP